MVKSVKYIIKRIIIGVGIALALMLIRDNLLIGVNAKEVSSYNWGSHQFTPLLSFTSSDFTLTSDDSLKNAGSGEILFTFNTYSGNNDKSPIVNTVRVYSGSSTFICNFGTVNSSSSSAYTPSSGISQTDNTSVSYSVVCPVNLGSEGLTRVAVFYLPYGSNVQDGFSITFSPYFSFIKDNDSTQDIIENDNDNTQEVINNANDNTQQQIESQKVCSMIDKNNISISSKYLGSDGAENSNSNFGITSYISISSSDSLTILSNRDSSAHYCFYDINKSKISCQSINTPIGTSISIPINASFFRSSIYIPSNKPTFNLCRNGNQAIADSQQQLNNSITDDSGVADSDLSDLFGELEESDTPISDLLLMPLTLLNAYLEGFNSNCQAINLGSLLGTNLVFPCINLESYLGSTLWGIIDTLISLFMIFNIGQLIVTAFDGITSLNDDFQVLYGARHAAAPSTRVERNSDLY